MIVVIKNSRKSIFSKRMLYVITSYWMLSLFVSSFNPYNMYPVSNSTYFWMVANVSFFLLGFLSYKNHKTTNYYDETIHIDELFKNKLFLAFLIVCIVFTLYIYHEQNAVIFAYNIGYLRENFAELMFEGKPMLSFIYMTVLKAGFEFSLFLALYLLIYKRDFHKIIPLLLFLVPFIFLSGGRTRAMMIAFYFVFLLVGNKLYNRVADTNSVLTFKLKHIIGTVIALLLIFLLFSYTSMLRIGYTELSLEALKEGVDKSLLQMCSYSVGPFRAFDIAIEKDYLNIVGGLKYGQATLGGLESFLERIIRHAFGLQIPNVNDSTLVYLQDTEITVGANEVTYFNFAYTNAIYHYFDFGYFGIVIWPLIFGRFFSKYTIIAESNPYIPSLALLAFCFEMAIYSVFSLLTVQPFALPYMFVLLFFIHRDLRKRR